MLAFVQAHNDWQTDWAAADPRRLLPIASTPFRDVDAAVVEIRRCIKGGLSDCDAGVKRKILWENASNLYRVESPPG